MTPITGTERVHADAPRRQLHGQRLRHEVHRPLRRVVPRQPWPRPDARCRPDVEHHAAAVVPHERHDGAHHVEDRLHVDGKNAIERRFVHLENRTVAVRDAGIVDDDVGNAERARRSRSTGRAHIIAATRHPPRWQSRRRRSRRRPGAPDRIRMSTAATPRAFRGEPPGHPFAEPAAGAGDERDLSTQSCHVPLSRG